MSNISTKHYKKMKYRENIECHYMPKFYVSLRITNMAHFMSIELMYNHTLIFIHFLMLLKVIGFLFLLICSRREIFLLKKTTIVKGSFY